MGSPEAPTQREQPEQEPNRKRQIEETRDERDGIHEETNSDLQAGADTTESVKTDAEGGTDPVVDHDSKPAASRAAETQPNVGPAEPPPSAAAAARVRCSCGRFVRRPCPRTGHTYDRCCAGCARGICTCRPAAGHHAAAQAHAGRHAAAQAHAALAHAAFGIPVPTAAATATAAAANAFAALQPGVSSYPAAKRPRAAYWQPDVAMAPAWPGGYAHQPLPAGSPWCPCGKPVRRPCKRTGKTFAFCCASCMRGVCTCRQPACTSQPQTSAALQAAAFQAYTIGTNGSTIYNAAAAAFAGQRTALPLCRCGNPVRRPSATGWTYEYCCAGCSKGTRARL